jgi:hypothetical protein
VLDFPLLNALSADVDPRVTSLFGGEMLRKQLTIAVLVSVCIFVGHAAAQRTEKNELSGLAGRQFVSDQVIPTSTSTDNLLRFGDGLSFEGNIARRVLDLELFSVSVEVPVVFNVDMDVHTHANPVSPGYKAFFVTPAGRVNLFAHNAVSPWVSVGGGFGHFSGSAVQGLSTGTTTGVFQIGGGLDVAFFRRFSLRGEARDLWSGVPNLNVSTNETKQHNLFVGGGIVWHF